MTSLPREHITGLVLAGGRGSRMGGIDKGLQLFNGVPLAQHALRRLQPQVGQVLLNANRNLGVYASFGVPVLSDGEGAWRDGPGHRGVPENVGPNPLTALTEVTESSDSTAGSTPFAGPLAGFLAGLMHCDTPYLVTVPCDTPHFPTDLVARLAAGLVGEHAEIAMAAATSGDGAPPGAHIQPVFCLIDRRLAESLRNFMSSGGRQVRRWAAQHATVVVPCPADDAAIEAFGNANTRDELRSLESRALPKHP